uniref:Uncharacterized protein n=1 Tax=Lepeophtheirus salmonis TaxID=72036 RepID=A0A0K2V9Q7_LEPSM
MCCLILSWDFFTVNGFRSLIFGQKGVNSLFLGNFGFPSVISMHSSHMFPQIRKYFTTRGAFFSNSFVHHINVRI